MNHEGSSKDPFFWKNLMQHPPEIQEQMLNEFAKLLPEMTWKESADVFCGAPKEIILHHLPGLVHEAQVRVWREYLPVGARGEAEVLLSPEARARLKPRGRKLCLA